MKLTRKGCPTEDYEQTKFVVWLTKNKLPFYAIPNGGRRTLMEGARFKRGGVKKGIPDLCLPIPKEPYHGLYIEMKTVLGGVISYDQKQWIKILNSLGYIAKVARGADEAIQITMDYLGLNDAGKHMLQESTGSSG
jgi:VRR-NUC domain